MSGFQGADVDGLDSTASRMLQAAEACTTIATALEVLAAALEAMSWTGFAAAFAAYLRGVVIPWVKATGRALQAFGRLLELTSSDQKAASGDTPVITTGSGGYTSPQMPSVSCGNGPQVASIVININTGQMGQGSGVQVDRPALPGSIPGSTVNPGGGSSGSGTGAPVPTAPTPTPLPTGPGSSGDGSGSVVGPGTVGGSAVPSGAVGATGGQGPVSGAGSTGGGGAGGGWSGNLGVSSRPDGGIDVEGSFRGTIGGDPASTSTPAVPAQGHSSIDSGVTTGKTPDGAPGGLNAGLLAAPLGLAGLGAALLGAKGAGATGADATGSGATTPGTGGATTPGTTPGSGATPPPAAGSGSLDDESGWRVLATAGADGQLGLSLVADTDEAPSALDLGGAAGQGPSIIGWLDGDGDYGFVADDLVFTTPAGEVTIDRLTLEGSLADDPTTAAAVRGWWATALAEGSSSTTPAPATVPAPAATPALATTAKESR